MSTLNMEYNIGYNPETTQERWNNPQTSLFGDMIRDGFNPLGGANYEWFPYDPIANFMDFMGFQNVNVPPAEFLYGNYLGYRGILPIGLQSVSPEPYPYELPYPYNMSA